MRVINVFRKAIHCNREDKPVKTLNIKYNISFDNPEILDKKSEVGKLNLKVNVDYISDKESIGNIEGEWIILLKYEKDDKINKKDDLLKNVDKVLPNIWTKIVMDLISYANLVNLPPPLRLPRLRVEK